MKKVDFIVIIIVAILMTGSAYVLSNHYYYIFSFHDLGKETAVDYMRLRVLLTSIPAAIMFSYRKFDKGSVAHTFWIITFWVGCFVCGLFDIFQDTSSWDYTSTKHMMVQGKTTTGPVGHFIISLFASPVVEALFAAVGGGIIFGIICLFYLPFTHKK